METLKHGPEIWEKTSPIVADHFNMIVFISLLIATTAQWTFASQFSGYNASFWSAYVCQNVGMHPHEFISVLTDV